MEQPKDSSPACICKGKINPHNMRLLLLILTMNDLEKNNIFFIKKYIDDIDIWNYLEFKVINCFTIIQN